VVGVILFREARERYLKKEIAAAVEKTEFGAWITMLPYVV
jgi:hypothetical protein